MPKFTLICEHDDSRNPSKNTLEFDAIFLDDVLEGFRQFLKGCTFEFSGNLELVDYEVESECYQGHQDSESDIGHHVFDNMAKTLMNVPESNTTTVCSVCKLPSSVMQRNLCFDANCGLK